MALTAFTTAACGSAAMVEPLETRLSQAAWLVLHDPPASGAENMARDLALLHAAAREELGPTLRFYSWNPPAVSLGRFQKPEGIDLSVLERRGWDLVRRPTGGRAVLHQHEVTYAIVLPPSVVESAGVRTSHAVLTARLNAGIRALLPELLLPPPPTCDARGNRTANCFALTGECDTVTAAGKLVGSAQARHAGALLQHGSILLDADRDAWRELFGDAGRLVTLRELAGCDVSPQTVMAAVRRSVCGAAVVAQTI